MAAHFTVCPWIRPAILGTLAVQFLISSPGIRAQSEELQPEAVVVTVTAAALPESVTSASVTVLSQAEIQASGAADMAELLRTVADLHVFRLGGHGSRASVSIRGSEENSVLVMLDGIPVNDLTDPAGGSLDLSRLGLDGVNRVEIVRGPVSSLYGSEAMAGVVNIITIPPVPEKGRRNRAVLEAGAGSHDAYRLGASWSYAEGPFGMQLAASRRKVGEQVEADESALSSLSFSGSLAAGAERTARMTARLTDGSTAQFPANGGGPEYSVLREAERQGTTDLVVGASLQGSTARGVIYAVGADRFSRDLTSRAPAILDGRPPGPNSLPSIRGKGDFSRSRLYASGQWTPAEDWTGHVLVEYRREAGAADYVLADVVPSGFEMDRNTAAAGAELAYSGNWVTAVGGVRFDRPGTYRAQVSPRVGATLALPGTRQRLKGNWGRGFRMPSFYALAEPNFGNPDLRPERTSSWDAGWEVDACGDRCRFSFTWFYTRYRDLVDFDPESFRLLNRDQVRAQGLEWDGSVRISDRLTVGGSAIFQDIEVAGSDAVLRNRPKWRGGGALGWKPLDDLSVRLGFFAVGSRHDFQVPVPELDRVSSYSTLDLQLAWRLNPQLELAGRIENLADRDYDEFVGFPAPGRSWWASLRWRVER